MVLLKVCSNILYCNYRYILQVKLEDHMDIIWVVAFDEIATKIMGMFAQELYTLQFNHEEKTSTKDVIRSVLLTQFLFPLS